MIRLVKNKKSWMAVSSMIRWALAALFFAGCASARPRNAEPQKTGDETPVAVDGEKAVKLRHQIVFRTPSDVQVFDGYFLHHGEFFIVKAFAGPGVELFTVVKGPGGLKSTLHIPGLEAKIDMAQVGADIGRIYLPGCVRHDGRREVACRVRSERLVETFDEEGRLVRRVYPEAHGVGLTIDYEDFAPHLGEVMAETIRLGWGKSPNEMFIKLLAAEHLPEPSRDIFR